MFPPNVWYIKVIINTSETNISSTGHSAFCLKIKTLSNIASHSNRYRISNLRLKVD